MPDASAPSLVRLELAWLGHATVHLQLPGLTVLTDPLFATRLGPLRRHGPAPEPANLPPPDVVLLSHAHPDHFSAASLRRIPGRPVVLVPQGLGRRVARLRPDVEVVEQRPGDRFALPAPGWAIRAVPARHWRSPVVPDVRAIGFLVDGPLGIYFAGDTARFAAMADLSGQVDVALLPIGRWGPQPTPGHLTPRTAALAAATIRPRVVVPIHWGTLYPAGLARLLPGPLHAPGIRFAAAAARQAPDVEVRLLEPGDRTTIELPARA